MNLEPPPPVPSSFPVGKEGQANRKQTWGRWGWGEGGNNTGPGVLPGLKWSLGEFEFESAHLAVAE